MVPLPILWSTINTLVKISILDLYVRPPLKIERIRTKAYSIWCFQTEVSK